MKKAVISWAVGLYLCILSPNLYAVQPELSAEDVQEAIRYGEKNSHIIFKSLALEPACLGLWPSLDSCLVRSKYVNLAVTAARSKRHHEKISEEEITEAVESTTLDVIVRTRDDVVIKLIQHDKMIEPASISYLAQHCEWCDFYGGEASKEEHEYVMGSFPYSEINPKLKTIVLFWDGGDERQYEVFLSKFK